LGHFPYHALCHQNDNRARSIAQTGKGGILAFRGPICLRDKENNMAKIRHLVFQTTDPERLAKFYVDVMGLEIVHRSKNGGISLTDGYMNLSIHTNKIDGKPSGFNHFGFLVEDNEALAERFEKLGYRPPLKRPGDRHYAEYRAIDPDGNNFDISANGYDEIRPDRVPAKEKAR
jgi:catechol 2,3-dioxygenase-like lactoylglutathione lyase family enzyme